MWISGISQDYVRPISDKYQVNVRHIWDIMQTLSITHFSSWIMHLKSRLIPASCIIHHAHKLCIHHASCKKHCASWIMNYAPIMLHVLIIINPTHKTYHLLCILFHASFIMHPASRIRYYKSCIMYPTFLRGHVLCIHHHAWSKIPHVSYILHHLSCIMHHT